MKHVFKHVLGHILILVMVVTSLCGFVTYIAHAESGFSIESIILSRAKNATDYATTNNLEINGATSNTPTATVAVSVDAGHGVTIGDYLIVDGVEGMTELNGISAVANTATATITLENPRFAKTMTPYQQGGIARALSTYTLPDMNFMLDSFRLLILDAEAPTRLDGFGSLESLEGGLVFISFNPNSGSPFMNKRELFNFKSELSAYLYPWDVTVSHNGTQSTCLDVVDCKPKANIQTSPMAAPTPSGSSMIIPRGSVIGCYTFDDISDIEAVIGTFNGTYKD